jgi:DNA repair exonuclease SbcCD ATPase subunit
MFYFHSLLLNSRPHVLKLALHFLPFSPPSTVEAEEARKKAAKTIRGDMAEKIYVGEFASAWDAAKSSACVDLGVSHQSIQFRLDIMHPGFVPAARQQRREIIEVSEELHEVEAEARASKEATALLARVRLANERRQSASEAARAREIQALEAAAAAQIERQKDEAAKEREKMMRLMDRVEEIAEVNSRHREATAKLEEKLAAAEAAGIAMLVKHAEDKKKLAKANSALKTSIRNQNRNFKRRAGAELRSNTSAEIKEGDSVEVASLKNKLNVARAGRRALSKTQARLANQSKTMAAKCKEFQRLSRVVEELEAELEDGNAGEAESEKEEGGRREFELFKLGRDRSKRGAPCDPVFEELIGPAMMASGASGNVIGEILSKCTLSLLRPYTLFFVVHFTFDTTLDGT